MGKKKSSSATRHIKKKKKENSLGYAFFVIPLVLLIFIYAIVLSVMEDGVYIYISPVFKRYEPLEKTEDAELENYFVDEAGLFYDEDRHRLINESAEYFYDKTGIKIFLYACPVLQDENNEFIYLTDKEANETCVDICNKYEAEGIDLVIMFMPTKMGFDVWTYSTDEVKDTFGNKCDILIKQYLEYNFNMVGEYDELFYYSYRNTADRLMGGLTSPFAVISENLRFFILAVIAIIVSASSVVFYKKFGNKF